MTTLVALATKDALVLGCDSLGSVTKNLIDPVDLIDFFDVDKDFKLKLDRDGKPLLRAFDDVYNVSKSIPIEHMTHLTKLFSLTPLRASVMITGIASIGERTIKNLIAEFRTEKITPITSIEYSVKDIAERLAEHIWGYYEKEFTEEKRRPRLELILGGYGKKESIPQIYRMVLPGRSIKRHLEESHFGIVFGGQMKEIHRIVFGTDFGNKLKLRERHTGLLRKYREKIIEFLKEKKISVEIPEPTNEKLLKELDLFGDDWDLDGFYAKWGDFSEQNAIECVDFFVNIMIKSQQFGMGMPTVGGEVHIVLITKEDGVRFISKEEYHHDGHYVPKHTAT